MSRAGAGAPDSSGGAPAPLDPTAVDGPSQDPSAGAAAPLDRPSDAAARQRSDAIGAPLDLTGWAGGLQPGRSPVVLSIDLMRPYFEPGSPFDVGSRAPLESAARVIAAARASGVPVVHTRVAYGPDGVDGGVFLRKVPALRALIGEGPANEIMPEVAPHPDELVLVKQYASAFFGTSLASTLASWRIDTVLVVGVSTSGCVRASALDAMQHGFIPLVVRDAVGDRDAPAHEANLHDLRTKYAEVIDEAAALAYLADPSRSSA